MVEKSWWLIYLTPILYPVVILIVPNSIVLGTTDDCFNPDNHALSTRFWLYTAFFAPILFSLDWLVFYPVVTVYLKQTIYQHKGLITTLFNILMIVLIFQNIAILFSVFPICGDSVQSIWLIVEIFLFIISSMFLAFFAETIDVPVTELDTERRYLLYSHV